MAAAMRRRRSARPACVVGASRSALWSAVTASCGGRVLAPGARLAQADRRRRRRPRRDSADHRRRRRRRAISPADPVTVEVTGGTLDDRHA